MENLNTTAIRTEIKAKCGKIFFFMILVCIFVKTNLFRVLDADQLEWFAYLPDALCAILIYYIYLFWHAKKGIVLRVKVETAELKKFPTWQYAKAAFLDALILAVASLALRFLVAVMQPGWEGMAGVWVFLLFFVLLLVGAFIVFYLSFLVAYCVAKRHVAVATASEGE